MEKLPTSTQSRVVSLGTKNDDMGGQCVLYVMSRDQRVHDNHALICAQAHALELKLPLAVIFVLNLANGSRALEHYDFMIDGLIQAEAELKSLNIPLITLVGKASEKLPIVFKHFRPTAVYVDFNPLVGPKQLAKQLAIDWPISVVDTHNIVPLWHASEKQEIGARTLRPKIHAKLIDYLVEPQAVAVHPYIWPNQQILSLSDVRDMFDEDIRLIRSNGTKHGYDGGQQAAEKELESFINHRLEGYAVKRNNPTINGLSNLSPYLHFGHISSLRVILRAQQALAQNPILQPDFDALVEEMVIRKELSDNYCYYNENYGSLAGAPNWARLSLQKHAQDHREFSYSLQQFEQAQTHDLAWNAAQIQLRTTGKIHGYMRMYWAKKVLEWSSSPEEALKTLLHLNDFYSLDGGDPNGYVGILWSIAGLHDRAWGERPVYGLVRSMVYSGLKRKFDIETYIAQTKTDEKIKKTNRSKSL